MIRNIITIFLNKLITYILLLLVVSVSLTGIQTSSADNNDHTNQQLLTSMQQLSAPNPALATNTPQEALAVANQFQTMAKTIETKQQNPSGESVGRSIFSISMVSKMKSIIAEIELQSKKLVDLITGSSTPDASDSAKLDDIANKLESQQQFLSSIIDPQGEASSSLPMNPDPAYQNNNRPNGNNFQVFSGN